MVDASCQDALCGNTVCQFGLPVTCWYSRTSKGNSIGSSSTTSRRRSRSRKTSMQERRRDLPKRPEEDWLSIILQETLSPKQQAISAGSSISMNDLLSFHLLHKVPLIRRLWIKRPPMRTSTALFCPILAPSPVYFVTSRPLPHWSASTLRCLCTWKTSLARTLRESVVCFLSCRF